MKDLNTRDMQKEINNKKGNENLLRRIDCFCEKTAQLNITRLRIMGKLL